MEPCYIGIDIGGTKTLLIVQQADRIIYEKRVDSTSDLSHLRSMVLECVAAAQGAPIGGLAIGVPGRVDRFHGRVIDAPALMWNELSLQDELFSGFDFPCTVENDARMALYGECSTGALKDSQNVVFIAIGTGLGSAIMMGGQLLDGAGFSAGEIGYCVFDPMDAALCRNRETEYGALERSVSGSALTEAARLLGITASEMLSSPQPDAQAQTRRFLDKLSVTIANLVCILNPEYVVLGGGVSESLEEHLDYIRSRVAQLTPMHVEILLSQFRNRAGALGACYRARMLAGSTAREGKQA
ncbi:MAG: ROK family protein [Aristaeellaceae bacterium]